MEIELEHNPGPRYWHVHELVPVVESRLGWPVVEFTGGRGAGAGVVDVVVWLRRELRTVGAKELVAEEVVPGVWSETDGEVVTAERMRERLGAAGWSLVWRHR